MGYFAEVGYTAEDLALDNEENGVLSVNEKPWFNVTLEYKLDGANLVAFIDPEKATVSASIPCGFEYQISPLSFIRTATQVLFSSI